MAASPLTTWEAKLVKIRAEQVLAGVAESPEPIRGAARQAAENQEPVAGAAQRVAL